MAPLVRASHKYLARLDDSQATGVPLSPGASTSAAAIPAAPSASAPPSTPVASSSRHPTPIPSTCRPSRVASGSRAAPVPSSSRAARVASTSRAAPYPCSPRPRRARSSAEVPIQYVGPASQSVGTPTSSISEPSRARRADSLRLDRQSLEHYAKADSSDAGPSRRDKGKGVDRGPPSPPVPSPFTRPSRVPLGQIGPDVFSSSLPAFPEEVDDNADAPLNDPAPEYPAYAIPDATTLHEMADGLQGDSAEVQAEIDRIRSIVNELVVQASLAEYEAEEALEAYRALLSHVDQWAGPEFAAFVRNEAAAVVVPDLEEWNYEDESQGTVGDEQEEALYQGEPAQDGQISYQDPSSLAPPTSPLARVHGKRRHDDEGGPGADDDAPSSPKRPRVEDNDSTPAPAVISRNPSPTAIPSPPTHSRSPSPSGSEDSLHRERTPSRSGSEDRSGSGSESGSDPDGPGRHHTLWDSPSSGSGKTCSVCGGKPVGSFCWTDLVSPDGWEPRALPARSSHQCRPARDISSWQSSVQEAQAGPSGAHDGSAEEEREDADDEAGEVKEEDEISVDEERDEEYQTLAQLAADLAMEEDNFPHLEELEEDELEEDELEEEDELAGDVSEEEDQLVDDDDAMEVPDEVAKENDSGVDVSGVVGDDTDDAMDDEQQEVQAPATAPTSPAAPAPSTPPAAPALVPGFQFPETANYRSPGIIPPLVGSSPSLPHRARPLEHPDGDERHHFWARKLPVWVPPRTPHIS